MFYNIQYDTVVHGKVYMRCKKKAQAPSAVPDGEQLANKSG